MPAPPDVFRVCCPVCEELLLIDRGGWAFVYSQALIHLGHCSKNISAQKAAEAAARVANGVEGEAPKE